jgi:hypothetical protein
MGTQPAASRAEKSVTFRYTAGHDLSATEREMWRSQLAATALVDALVARDEFWGHAAAVRRSADPEREAVRLAGCYCKAKRKPVIATLLERAALTEGLQTAAPGWQRFALLGIGVCAVSQDSARKGHYAVGEAFIAPLFFAAHLVAARGAGRCLGFVSDAELAPETPCRGKAATGSLYCRRHDRAADDRLRWDAERERRVRRLFALAGRFILAAEMVAVTQADAA